MHSLQHSKVTQKNAHFKGDLNYFNIFKHNLIINRFRTSIRAVIC
jgi:hypothetical protein